MKRQFAQLISLLFNPVVMLLPVPYLLLRRAGEPMAVIQFWLLVTWVFLFLFCLLMVYMVRKKVFTNLDISNREQRPLFFLIILIDTLIFYLVVIIYQAPLVLYAATLGVLFAILLISFINLWIKASIHMAALSAFIFTVMILRNESFAVMLPILPVVAWSRLYLKKHTFPEIVAGTGAGILLTFILYILFKYIFVLGI
jgi:membrane-associated phospholipid phosphatase